MPHYRDGTEAKMHDEVIGQGYNVKHAISGVVVGITPGADCCNIQVAHARVRPEYVHSAQYPVIDVEYGEAKAFERIDLHEKRLEDEKAAAAKMAELNERLRRGESVTVEL